MRRTERNAVLAAAMATAGHTGRSLAAEVGCTEGSISRLLCKRGRPGVALAVRIAAAVNAPVAELFGDKAAPR